MWNNIINMILLNTSSREVILSRFLSFDTQAITEHASLQSWWSQIHLPHYRGTFSLKDSLTWSPPSFVYFNNVQISTGYSLPFKSLHGLTTTFFFFIFKLFYCCSITVVCIFFPPPPHPNPPPSPASTLPLGFVHVSFIVVPENPSPHYPLPPPLWLLLDCS